MILESAGVKSVRLPPRSPNLNAFAERFVRSIKEECLERMILIGEGSLQTGGRSVLRALPLGEEPPGLGNKIIEPDFSWAVKGRCNAASGLEDCCATTTGMPHEY